MINEEYIPIGTTIKTIGYKGELRIHIEEEFVNSFNASPHIFLEDSPSPLPFFQEYVFKKDGLILKLEEIRSKEDAAHWTSKEILLRKEDIIEDELERFESAVAVDSLDEFMLQDDGKDIGKINRVEEYPDQFIAFVTIKGVEQMIPIHEDLILSVDPEKKILNMNLPEGLLDL